MRASLSKTLKATQLLIISALVLSGSLAHSQMGRGAGPGTRPSGPDRERERPDTRFRPAPRETILVDTGTVVTGDRNQIRNQFVITSNRELIQYQTVDNQPTQRYPLNLRDNQNLRQGKALLESLPGSGVEIVSIFALNDAGNVVQIQWSSQAGWASYEMDPTAMGGEKMAFLLDARMTSNPSRARKISITGVGFDGRGVELVWDEATGSRWGAYRTSNTCR